MEVNASITCNIAEDAVISGSKEEFRQVLLNIILNALDVVAGMPSHPFTFQALNRHPAFLL
ncbi:hypothetical protein KEH51_18365 [[Brevibacterium] frigoritolerans]|uniref:Uncharacterized protein n=1 Tax=Peribacillus frigoritolerans TaxID=450367 RepID=A0A941FL05_9BACI|nr:hypothetical protein [Peribacillus frigoritolerans]